MPYHFIAMLGAYVQTKGMAHGVVWDTASMEPLVNTPAGLEVLGLIREMYPLSSAFEWSIQAGRLTGDFSPCFMAISSRWARRCMCTHSMAHVHMTWRMAISSRWGQEAVSARGGAAAGGEEEVHGAIAACRTGTSWSKAHGASRSNECVGDPSVAI